VVARRVGCGRMARRYGSAACLAIGGLAMAM